MPKSPFALSICFLQLSLSLYEQSCNRSQIFYFSNFVVTNVLCHDSEKKYAYKKVLHMHFISA